MAWSLAPRELGLALSEFGPADGGDAQGGGVGELLGVPADEGAGDPPLLKCRLQLRKSSFDLRADTRNCWKDDQRDARGNERILD